jgi:hypothetical protein
MAGKYAHVIAKLPRYLGTEPKYQEKVEAVKKEMLRHPCDCGMEGTTDLSFHSSDCAYRVKEPRTFIYGVDLAKQYIDIRTEIEALEAKLSEANLRLESTSQLLTDQFEVEDTSSMQINGRGTVRTQYEPYAKVEDKEAFRKWCIENGLEQSLALPWQSTNAITKERLLEGKSEPTGVTATSKVKVVFTKEK